MLKKKIALLLSAITVFSYMPVYAEETTVDSGEIMEQAGTSVEEATTEDSEIQEMETGSEEETEYDWESSEFEILDASEESDELDFSEPNQNMDVSEEEDTIFSDGTDDNTSEYASVLTSEDNDELLSLVSDAENVDAPSSRVDSLNNDTYNNVTVNAYVAGKDNTILGVNAYMTNPKNPFGIGEFGVPTDPVYNNVNGMIVENNTATVTVELKNPVFQLCEIGKADNAEVISYERGTGETDQSEYGYRIKSLTLKLKDLSGLYVFNNSKEIGLPLADGNPETDDTWNAPLYLTVDFEELLPGNSYSNKIWTDDTTEIGLQGRGKNLADKTLAVTQITEGEVYNQYKQILEDNRNKNVTGSSFKDTFYLYKVGLKGSDDGDYTQVASDHFKLLVKDSYELAGGTGLSLQAYVVRDGKLQRLSMDEAVTLDKNETTWTTPYRFSNFDLGYIILTQKKYNIKCDKTFSDKELDVSLTYYSDECGQSNAPTSTTFQTARFKARNAEDVVNSSSKKVLDKIKETYEADKLIGSADDGYIESAYGIWAAQLDGETNKYIAMKHVKKRTAQDVILPIESTNDANYQFYLVTIENGECTSVKSQNSAVVDNTHIKIRINDYKDATKEGTAYYAAATGDTSQECTYLTVVRKTKTAEVPVINADLTYNGSEQIGVPEGTGYTLTGAAATDAGTYTATATLSKGYVWADGTTDPVTLTWEIARKTAAAKPTAKSGLVYIGSKQSAVAEGEGYNLTGTKEATDAGSYKVNVILSPNYVWPDGTSDNLSLNWTIAKADQKITAKVGSKSYKLADLKKKKASFTIGAKASGKVTYKVQSTPSSKAKSYISVNGSGKVTMKKGAPAGTYKVRVSAASTSNYNAATKDVKITVKKANQKITAKVSSKNYKASSLKKKKATFTIGASAKGELSYKVTSTPSKKAAKYISVSKSGKVTMKKKAPKGTYKITVTAKATSAYNSATKTIKIVVK